MSSSIPIVRPLSWSAALLQMVVYGIGAGLGHAIAGPRGFMLGLGLCVLYSLISRYVVLRDHRAGISLTKQQRFNEAIARFEASLNFLGRHSWIDRYRGLVLMSPAAMSYREMALANIGFCYSQIGDGENARRYYKACLDEFPRNGLATAALRMMESVRKSDGGAP